MNRLTQAVHVAPTWIPGRTEGKVLRAAQPLDDRVEKFRLTDDQAPATGERSDLVPRRSRSVGPPTDSAACEPLTGTRVGDPSQIRCWTDGSPSPKYTPHDGIEVDLFEESSSGYEPSHEDCVRVRTGRVMILWAAFPGHALRIKCRGPLHRLVVPLDLFLSRGLPERLVVGLLSGQLLSAEIDVPSVVANKWTQWEDDCRFGVRDVRTAMLLEIDGWLRRIAPSLVGAGPRVAGAATSLSPRSVDVVAAMSQYVVGHFREPIQVVDVARAANVHPQHATVLLRDAIGLTIVEYLTRCRVAEARRLLAITELNTGSIAFASGFGSVSQFYKCFTEACERTPRQYRLETCRCAP